MALRTSSSLAELVFPFELLESLVLVSASALRGAGVAVDGDGRAELAEGSGVGDRGIVTFVGREGVGIPIAGAVVARRIGVAGGDQFVERVTDHGPRGGRGDVGTDLSQAVRLAAADRIQADGASYAAIVVIAITPGCRSCGGRLPSSRSVKTGILTE